MSDPHEDSLHRRRVLCGGGAFAFAAMIASLLGGSKPVRAQTITGSVPEIDRYPSASSSTATSSPSRQAKRSVPSTVPLWLGPELRQARRQDANQRVRPVNACQV